MRRWIIAACLLVMLPFIPTTPAGPGPGAGPVTHAGCVELGWSGLPPTPIPMTQVKYKATYVDFGSPNAHPAPYDAWPCATAGHPVTAWTSWASSCFGVPAGAAVFGAWCGPVVGPSGFVICTVDKVAGFSSDGFTLAFDVNHDGVVNEFDDPGLLIRSSTEFYGAGPAGPVTGKTPFGSQTLPIGARMIAFPLSTKAFGATEPANFQIGCISP